MSESTRIEINADLAEALRRVAEAEGRSEEELFEYAVRFYLMSRAYFARAPEPGVGREIGEVYVEPEEFSSSGLLAEILGSIDRGQRERGVEPLSEEEAMRLADEELHAMRRERGAGR